MTSNPCTIDADQSVAYAAKMMLEEDVGLAPIVEGDRLIGMLTDRDIATRVAAEGRDPDQVKVRDVASTQLVTIDPQQDLDDALRMMAKHQVRRLPVVEEDGRLVGVVAQADIARAGDDSKTGQLVEEISESGGQMSSIEEGQFPRQVEDQPESLVSQEGEPGQLEEQREEEGVSKVQAASSRGRKRRTTSRKQYRPEELGHAQAEDDGPQEELHGYTQAQDHLAQAFDREAQHRFPQAEDYGPEEDRHAQAEDDSPQEDGHAQAEDHLA